MDRAIIVVEARSRELPRERDDWRTAKIQLRMARLVPAQAHAFPAAPRQDGTALAFSYLTIFRRVVVSLAVIGAVVAYVEQWPGLFAVFVCVGIGELLESSYYLSVLHWREHGQNGRGMNPPPTILQSLRDASPPGRGATRRW